MSTLKKIDRLLRDSILFIYDLLKFIPLKAVDSILSYSASGEFSKEIFLIKLDEIGDYILFRNFLPFIKGSEKHSDYKVVLCGNIAWKNLAENLDANYVDEFIWLDKKKFSTNFVYRYKFLKMIAARNSLISINCSYSRSFYIDDAIIHAIKIAKKIGFKTDLSNSYKWQIKFSNSYYNELINSEEERFDFYKNRILFTRLLQAPTPIAKPVITYENNHPNFRIDGNYAIFFIGGRLSYKRWSLNNFIKLGEYLIQNYNLKIVLAGSFSEKNINEKFLSKIKTRELVVDLTGKTTLLDLIKILGDAKLLVSNDTGIVHVAASINTPTTVLANGTHLGRFLPYPDDINNKIKVIYPLEIMALIEKKDFSNKNLIYRSLYDINSIRLETVMEEVDKILLSTKNDKYL